MSRQRIEQFRPRLNELARKIPTGQSERIFINESGSISMDVPSRGLEHRLLEYGRRRLGTVAREMVLVERMLRFGAISPNTSVTCTGAFWQAFRGTLEVPACHTSPGLLRFDGHVPTVPLQNVQTVGKWGLMRHLVLVFADCMLMPKMVNRIDSFVDEEIGRRVLADSAEMVLVHGASPREATQEYISTMRELFSFLLNLSPKELENARSSSELVGPTRKEISGEGELKIAHDTISTYDEVMMHGLPEIEIRQYEHEVDAEISS